MLRRLSTSPLFHALAPAEPPPSEITCPQLLSLLQFCKWGCFKGFTTQAKTFLGGLGHSSISLLVSKMLLLSPPVLPVGLCIFKNPLLQFQWGFGQQLKLNIHIQSFHFNQKLPYLLLSPPSTSLHYTQSKYFSIFKDTGPLHTAFFYWQLPPSGMLSLPILV